MPNIYDIAASIVRSNEHIKEVGATIMDIWSEADMEQKKKIKSDMSKLLNDMIV